MGLGFLFIQPFCLLISTFSPFTFMVVIPRHVLIAILFIIFWLFVVPQFLSFLLALFICTKLFPVFFSGQ